MDIKPVTAIKERDKQALEAYETLRSYCGEQGLGCKYCPFFVEDDYHAEGCIFVKRAEPQYPCDWELPKVTKRKDRRKEGANYEVYRV